MLGVGLLATAITSDIIVIYVCYGVIAGRQMNTPGLAHVLI